MPFLILRDVPRYECLQEAASRVPGMDASSCAVYLNVLRTGDVVSRAEAGFLARHGLNQARLIILILLEDSPVGSLRSSELAERANVSRATMTGLLDNLERAQLIRRMPDANDRRATNVRLTPKGRVLVRRVRPLFLKWSTERLGEFSAVERDQFLALLKKAQEAFAPEESS